MMKRLLVLFAAAGICLLASCAHNGFFLGQGRVLLINGSGLTYVNGFFASGMSRENTDTEVEIQNSDGIGNVTGTSQMVGGIKVRRKIGKQITGYLVDLAKVSSDAAKEYVSSEEKIDNEQMNSLPSYEGKGTAGKIPAKGEEKADAPADDEDDSCLPDDPPADPDDEE